MSIQFEGQNFSVRIVSRKIRSVQQDFEVVIRPQIALCIPVTVDGNLVLIRQYRAAIDNAILEFPAGRLELGEASERAATRELLEEAGFLVNQVRRLGRLLTAPHFSDEVINIFVATGQITEMPSPTPKEDLREIIQAAPSIVDQFIARGQIVDSKTVAAWSLARLGWPLFGGVQ